PEVLFEDAERQAPAVGAFENVVDRKEVRARIDIRVEAVAHRRPEEPGFEERDIYHHAAPRLFPLVQGGKNCDRREATAAHVGDGVGGARGRFEPLAREGKAARRGNVVHVVPRPPAPRPGLTVARDRAVDDLWVVGVELLVIDAEAYCDTGPKAFDDDVRLLHQLFNHVRRVFSLEIDGEA